MKAFERIAAEVIQSAGRVPCSIEDYKAGMELIVEEIKVAISAAEEDLDQIQQYRDEGGL